MNKIFEQAKDLHVRAVVVYGKAADHKLYWKLSGSTYSEQLEEAELQELFQKGLLIIDDGTNKMIAVNLAANKVKTLAMTGASGSEVMSFVEWAAVAAE